MRIATFSSSDCRDSQSGTLGTAGLAPRRAISPEDAALEARIQYYYEAGNSAGSPEQARCCYAVMAQLISQRSPERIAEMERERNLA